MRISIIDTNGQRVYLKTVPKVREAEIISVDLTHLSNGVYFYQVIGKGKTSGGKLIKSN